ncbi:transposon Tf2-9 polyprotein [Trichonephila clavipes]|nr:transposon Tf2-9 polyprotein [Trichonephila clavipes]
MKDLLNEFSDRINGAQLHNMMQARRLKPTKTLQEYFLTMRDLAHKGAVDDSSLMDYIIGGIPDSSNNKIILYGSKTLSEFKDKLKIYETLFNTNHSKQFTDKRFRDYENSTSNQHIIEHKRVTNKQPVCYLYGLKGHKSTLCPNKERGKKCYGCKTFGHVQAECPKNSRNITPITNHKTNTQLDRTVNSISILTLPKSLMHVEITISKIPSTALCDTGSQATIINEKTYQKLGSPTLNPSQCTFSEIGRDRVESKGYFQNFITIQNTALPAKIHVVNDEAIPLESLDAIIGMDFLQQTQFTFGRNGIRIFRDVDECKNDDVLDEVEKLAYQLNEEAERTERPIRRLSKVMYGSTCADMQVDVMGECLSSIKHVVGRERANNQSVRRHLDAFTRGRIIGKLEEGRSVTSVAAEFGIAHSIVSRLWRQFQTTGTAIRGFSSGRPRGTTPADDRYIVLQARRNRRQTAGEIARHTTQATGRPISRFTVTRRLHGGDESRFSLSSDSHRILIWRERVSRNHPSNIIERDRYGGRGVLVWGGIMLGSRTDLHIFDAGSVNGTRYCNEILLPYVRLFRGAMGLQFLFIDDNAPCHRKVAAEQLLESRRLAARTLPPVMIRELRLALQDEWTAMPQQLIDTLILSMGRRCETCLAVRGDHIPY